MLCSNQNLLILIALNKLNLIKEGKSRGSLGPVQATARCYVNLACNGLGFWKTTQDWNKIREMSMESDIYWH